MDFAVHAAALSAEVDNRLGDSILYAIDGASGAEYVAMKGRIFAAEAPAGFRVTDEVAGGWKLRINKALVPNPSKTDRLQCTAILGETVYRPVAKDPLDDGRYWVVDIQKV